MQCPTCRACEHGDHDHCLAEELGYPMLNDPPEHCLCLRNKHKLYEKSKLNTKFMCWFL